MNRLLLPTLLAAATLAGCASTAVSVPPALAAPVAVAADTGAWQAPLPHGGRSAELAGWWRSFDDPLLPGLIDAAQAVSPSLASARARIERARATLSANAVTLNYVLDVVSGRVKGSKEEYERRIKALYKNRLDPDPDWWPDETGEMRKGK